MIPFSRNTLAGLALATLTAVGACSSTTKYDADAVADSLKETQQAAVGDLELGDANCPQDAALKEGLTIECTLEVGDAVAPYTVVLTNVDEDEANIEVAPAKAIIDVSKGVDFLRSNIDAEYADADIACGDAAVVIADPGDTIDCTVEFDGDVQNVVLVVNDLKGNISLQP